jgi:DNA-binding IclR family transcriptional regulator
VLAAVWISGIAGRMPKSRFAAVAQEVVQTAQTIERRLQA